MIKPDISKYINNVIILLKNHILYLHTKRSAHLKQRMNFSHHRKIELKTHLIIYCARKKHKIMIKYG
jgi:hypothetical protein